MSILSRLFGKSSSTAAPEAEPEDYNGYRIFPEPAGGDGGFRIGARIEKEIAGEVKTHTMIRADTYGSAGIASDASVSKAKQLIDQQGDAIFG